MRLKRIIFFILCISLLLTNHQCKAAHHFIDKELFIAHSLIIWGSINLCCIGVGVICFSLYKLTSALSSYLSPSNAYKNACVFHKLLTHTKIIANKQYSKKKIFFSSDIDHLTIEKQAYVTITVNPLISDCFIEISAASNITDLIKTNEKNNHFTVNYGNYIIPKDKFPSYDIHIQKLNSLIVSNTKHIVITGLTVDDLVQQHKKKHPIIEPPETKESITQYYTEHLNTLPLLTIQLNNSTIQDSGYLDRKILLNTYGNSKCYRLSPTSTISFNAHGNSHLAIYGKCNVQGNLYDYSTLNITRYERDYKKVHVLQHGLFTKIYKTYWE